MAKKKKYLNDEGAFQCKSVKAVAEYVLDKTGRQVEVFKTNNDLVFVWDGHTLKAPCYHIWTLMEEHLGPVIAAISGEQPDPVCLCGKTSTGICPRCGQNMDNPVPLSEKLMSLDYCIRQGAKEDALCHLFDLLHLVVPDLKIEGSVETIEGIEALHTYYGAHPVRIKVDE